MIVQVFKMVDTVKRVLLVAVLICIQSADGFTHRRFRSPYNYKIQTALPSTYSYKTLYMTQNVDHFGFDNGQTFQQRYLVANQFWNDDGGPIFFYTGNEGDITWFCNNTGFVWDTAPEFKALIVYAEHRYYGQSLPFGSESFKNTSMLNFLSAEQALADFAELIKHIKQTVPGASSSQVIAIGGSYGGMLAAWMRLKYPNLVTGALAASAPIWQFPGLSACGSYYEIVQRTFQTTSQQCVDNIAKIWYTLDDYWPGNLTFLSQTFSFCKPIEDKYALSDMLDWVLQVLGNLAIVNYPYPASFLESLPAWPVKEFCKFLSVPLDGDDLTLAMSRGIKMYFNYTGQASCIDMSQTATDNLGKTGWDYQTCTEMVHPICSNNTGMIFNIDWTFEYYAAQCKYTWGLTPRQNWMSLQYWGKDILSASNIIFSNGLLDPWSGAGVLQSLSPTLVAIQIPNGAHQLDLRAQNPEDTADVRAAREQEKNIMKQWLYGPQP